MDLALRAKNIRKSFAIKGDKISRVLKGVNFEIEKGGFAAIMGPSGVGKTALLHILGSIDKPDSGEVEIFVRGKKYLLSSAREKDLNKIRSRYIGFVFQFHCLLPEFTALENAALPCLIAGKSRSEANKKAMELLELTGVANQANQKPAELSGGESQRVALARALANDPEILFADEPTGNLDKRTAGEIIDLIKTINLEKKTAIVMVTHSQSAADKANVKYALGDGVLKPID